MAALYATTLENWMKKKEAGEISQQNRLDAIEHKRNTQAAMAELTRGTAGK